MAIYFPPPRREKTRRCDRCNLLRPLSGECPHCARLSDAELARMKRRVEDEQEAHTRLGKIFLFLAGVFAGLTLLLWLA